MKKIFQIFILLLFIYVNYGCHKNTILELSINEIPTVCNTFQEDLKISSGSLLVQTKNKTKIVPIDHSMITGYVLGKTEDQVLTIHYQNKTLEWVLELEDLLPENAKVIKSTEDFYRYAPSIQDGDLLIFYPQTYKIHHWIIQNQVEIIGIDQKTTMIEINNDNTHENSGIILAHGNVSISNLTIYFQGQKQNYALQMASLSDDLSNIHFKNVTFIGGDGIQLQNVTNTFLNQVTIQNTKASTLVLKNCDVTILNSTLESSPYGSIYLCESSKENHINIDSNTKLYGCLCIENCKGNEKLLTQFKEEWNEVSEDHSIVQFLPKKS